MNDTSNLSYIQDEDYIKKQHKCIENIINNEISMNRISGANILLLQHGSPIYRGSFGLADIENNIPMRKDTIFRLFSMSKIITSVAGLMLVERGIIDMYEPVSKYLEGFRHQNVIVGEEIHPCARPVLIRDLFNMTSGLSYPNEDNMSGKLMIKLFEEVIKEQDKGNYVDTISFANKMGQVPLAFAPGDAWQYGTSADVLGAVIEAASGKKFSKFLEDELFIPLGMTDTGFYVPEEKKARFAAFYDNNEENHTLKIWTDRNLGLEGYDHKPAFESGGAGMVSTIDDYSKFALMLLNNGEFEGRRYLGRKTVEFLHTNQLNDVQKPHLNWDSLRGYDYGNLVRILKSPAIAGSNSSAGEYGWDGWCGTYITINPAEDFIMLYFIQRCNTGCNDTTRKLRSIAYSLL